MLSLGHLDLLSLRIFVLAAHTRSLTETAVRFHMTLSAVSRRVRALEDLAGEPFFERRAQGLELTAAGQALLVHAQAMVASAETLVRSMDDFSRVGQGRVRIWANISAVVQFLPKDLYAFQTTHPRIRIELEERSSEETLHALRSGDIDVGIVADNKLSAGLLQRPYREDRLVAVVPRDHPVAQLESVGFGDIADRDLVGFNHGSDILRRLDVLASAEGKLLRIRVRATSFEAVLSLVEAGHGLGVLPRAVVSSRLSDRHLAAIPIHEEWARRRLWITFRGSGGTGAEADSLIRFLEDRSAP